MTARLTSSRRGESSPAPRGLYNGHDLIERKDVLDEPEALPSLGPLESQVLGLLWEKSDLTVRDVHEQLLSKGSELAYTTVMTVMVRLNAKGLLSRAARGKQFVYQPVVSEEAFRERAARALAENLIRNYDRLAIGSFVEELAKVSPDRLKELRQLADKTYRKNERPS